MNIKNKQGYYLYKNTKLLKYNDELVYVTPREIVNSNVTSKSTKHMNIHMDLEQL